MKTERVKTFTIKFRTRFSENESRSALILLGIQITLVCLLFATAVLVIIKDTSDRRVLYLALIVSLLALIIAALILNLLGKYKVSAWLTTIIVQLGPWVSILLDNSIIKGDFVPLIYITLSIQLCSILLSERATLLIAAVQLLSLSTLVLLSPHLMIFNWASLIVFVVFISTLGIVASFTARKQMEQLESVNKELDLSEKKYSNYIKNAPDGVFISDENGHYLEVNRAASEITGYSNDELLNMTISDLLPDESLGAGMNQFKRLLETGKSSGEIQFKHKDGTKGWWSVDAIELTEHRFIGFVKDITDRKKAEEKIIYLSYHDQLTGLYNRRFYEEELKRLDTKRNYPLTIVMGDVNGLKLINDSLGHDMGDELLKKAAEVMKMGCRTDDIIARLGGDEFVILLPRTDALEAEQIIKRINDLSRKAKKGNMDISISFGYKTKCNKEEKIQDIFKNAEDMMYRNKLSESSITKLKTVDVVMKTLFKKNNREQSHSIKVSEICEDIATKMGFNKHDVSQIRTAGLMHDIGKIDINGKILNKSQKLNEAEWNEIKRHPEKGYRILRLVDQFSEIAKYVFEHHEKWDGTGYPRGLKGEEIALPARIIAVADSYDAMTTDRVYAKALSKEEAINEIIRCSGTHFDPEIAAIFVKMISTT